MVQVSLTTGVGCIGYAKTAPRGRELHFAGGRTQSRAGLRPAGRRASWLRCGSRRQCGRHRIARSFVGPVPPVGQESAGDAVEESCPDVGEVMHTAVQPPEGDEERHGQTDRDGEPP